MVMTIEILLNALSLNSHNQSLIVCLVTVKINLIKAIDVITNDE